MYDIYTTKNTTPTPRNGVPGWKCYFKSVFFCIFTFMDCGKIGNTMGNFFSHAPNDATLISEQFFLNLPISPDFGVKI